MRVTLPPASDGVEPDPLDVDRAELALDDEPPRAGRRSGAQPTCRPCPGRRCAARDRRAERRAVGGAGCAGVVHHAVGDGVVTAAAAGATPAPRAAAARRRRCPPARPRRRRGWRCRRCRSAEIEQRTAVLVNRTPTPAMTTAGRSRGRRRRWRPRALRARRSSGRPARPDRPTWRRPPAHLQVAGRQWERLAGSEVDRHTEVLVGSDGVRHEGERDRVVDGDAERRWPGRAVPRERLQACQQARGVRRSVTRVGSIWRPPPEKTTPSRRSAASSVITVAAVRRGCPTRATRRRRRVAPLRGRSRRRGPRYPCPG